MKPPKKSLRDSADPEETAVILYEAGEILRIDEASVREGFEGCLGVMRELGMLPRDGVPRRPEPAVLHSDGKELRMYFPGQGVLEVYPIDQRLSELAASPLPRAKCPSHMRSRSMSAPTKRTTPNARKPSLRKTLPPTTLIFTGTPAAVWTDLPFRVTTLLAGTAPLTT